MDSTFLDKSPSPKVSRFSSLFDELPAENVSDVKTQVILGKRFNKGGLTSVYNLKDDPSKLFKITPFQTSLDLEDLKEETEFEQELSRAGLAPQLYKSFKDKHARGAVVEKFNMDLDVYLRKARKAGIPPDPKLGSFLKQILWNLAGRGIECLDVKPKNFVVNVDKDTGEIQALRIIDFGGNWCTRKHDPELAFITMLFLLHHTLSPRPFARELKIVLRDPRVFHQIQMRFAREDVQNMFQTYHPGENLQFALAQFQPEYVFTSSRPRMRRAQGQMSPRIIQLQRARQIGGLSRPVPILPYRSLARASRQLPGTFFSR